MATFFKNIFWVTLFKTFLILKTISDKNCETRTLSLILNVHLVHSLSARQARYNHEPGGKRPFWSLLRKSNLFLGLSYENIQVSAIFFSPIVDWIKKFKEIADLKNSRKHLWWSPVLQRLWRLGWWYWKKNFKKKYFPPVF